MLILQHNIILFSVLFCFLSLNDAVLVASSALSGHLGFLVAHKLMFLINLASVEFELSYCYLNQSPSALEILNNHKCAQNQHTYMFVFLH